MCQVRRTLLAMWPRYRHTCVVIRPRANQTDAEVLWRAHAVELTRYARLLVGPIDAQDVVSQAFVKVVGGGVRDPANVRAYLFRAITNTVIDAQRVSNRRLARDRHALIPDSASPHESQVDVRRAIERLPVRQRAVVYFTYWEDMDAMQVAYTLRITPSTVRRDLRRAHARLQRSVG